MQTVTEKLIDLGFANRVLTDKQFGRVVDGTRQARYNLVNRAVNAGELIRLKQGVYILNAKYRDSDFHPYAYAQVLVPGSYISLETALAYHGWIPEAVFETASISPGRKTKKYESEQFGIHSFHPLALNKGYFLELVDRVQINHQTMLIAQPIRALMDLVCYKKMEWSTMDWIVKGMRIDNEALRSVTEEDMSTLQLVYKQRRAQRFLVALSFELGLNLNLN